MSIKRIQQLDVASLAADDCLLLLWSTNGLLETAIETARIWGWTYRNCIAWVKSRPGRPTRYLQSNCEFLLYCTRGDVPAKANQQTVLMAPTAGHSEKPLESFVIAERIGNPPFLELFSRGTNIRESWLTWGNETFSTVRLHGAPVGSDFLEDTES